VSFDDPAWLEEERRCLRALRRGDERAFATLYRAFAQPLYARVLLPRLGDPQAAEDALAETFRTMIEKLDRYEDRGGSVWSWLATVAANKAHDAGRAAARDGQARRRFELLAAPLLAEEGAPQAAADARLGAAVAAVLATINPRYRRALELRFLEDRPRAECAELMQVKLGTFDVLLLRALRAFRDAWKTTGEGAEAPAPAGRPVNA
jgi:RNA polymerase sigma-70 factor (ECF subfamily)